jgi:hypothetical protein
VLTGAPDESKAYEGTKALRALDREGSLGLHSTGSVRSWGERQGAERIAWAAPGTVQVENRIVINP